jgi:hypothetical protein
VRRFVPPIVLPVLSLRELRILHAFTGSAAATGPPTTAAATAATKPTGTATAAAAAAARTAATTRRLLHDFDARVRARRARRAKKVAEVKAAPRRPRRKGDRVERRTAEVDLEVVEQELAPAPDETTDDALLAGLDSVMAGMEARLATIRAL